MKKCLLLWLSLLVTSLAFAQTPNVERFVPGTGGSSQLFGANTARKTQLLYLPGELSNAATGQIDAIYFMHSGTATGANPSLGPITLTDLTIKMKMVSASALTTTFETGMTTVLSSASYTIPAGTAGSWFRIPLTTPFQYNATQSVIIEVSSSATTNTGFLARTGTSDVVGTNRKLIANNPAATTGTLELARQNIGFDLTPLQGANAGIADVVAPVAPVIAGPQPVSITIKNYSPNTTLTSATINWTVNGVAQTPVTFNGSVAPGAVSAPVVLSNSFNFASGTDYVLEVATSQPNGTADVDPANDKLTRKFCIAMSGNYTINAAGTTGARNFKTFADAIDHLACAGVSAPVVFSVAPGSGPYNEQIDFPFISGSLSNSITFKGNGATITALPTATTAAYVVRFNGSQNIVLDSFNIALQPATIAAMGVQMFNGAEFNTVTNSRIVMPAAANAANYFGVVFGGSATSATAAGSAILNFVTNTTIVGGHTGIHFAGIANSLDNFSNTCKNNNIEDFSHFGINLDDAASPVISNNSIHRPNRALGLDVFKGINLQGTTLKAVISNNRIHNPYGADPAGNKLMYGIYSTSNDAPAGQENLIYNNLIYNFNGTSGAYGIYNTGSDGVRYYHNSISIDNPAPTSSSASYGIYQTTAASNLEVVNNIIRVTRNTTGKKYGLYFGTATSAIVSNYNVIYVNGGADNYIGRWGSNEFITLPQWRTANPTAPFDTNSVSIDPQYANWQNGNLKPQNAALDNSGKPLALVTDDFDGAPRSTTTPDPGAYEVSFVGTDASITWLAPAGTVPAGNTNVTVRITNTRSVTLTSLSLGYTDGVQTQTETFNGLSILPQATQDFTFATAYNLSGSVQLRAFITAVNGSPDDDRANDTTAVQSICSALAGAYTINAGQATGGRNFQSFSAAVTSLQTCGVAAPVVFTVVAGSGPYNEQIEIPEISGSSALNTITFKGNNEVISFSATSATAQHVIKLNRADYIIFDSLTINATGTTYGAGIHLTNKADYIVVTNSTINVVANTSTSGAGAIIASSDVNSLTGSASAVSNHTNFSVFSNNVLTGGYATVRIVGKSNERALGNRIENNIIRDFYAFGVNLHHVDSTIVRRNEISRPGATSSNFLVCGINVANPSTGASSALRTIIDGNRIHNLNSMGTSNITYAIQLNDLQATGFGLENIIQNNLITNLNAEGSTAGAFLYASPGIKVYHNTIAFSNSANNANQVNGILFNTTPSKIANVELKNNIFSINMVGTAAKRLLKVLSANVVLDSDYNVFDIGSGLSNAALGEVTSTVHTTLASWRTATANDSNSIVANPVFVNPSAGNYEPSNFAFDNAGTPLTAVTTDIRGAARSATAPDPGAYEFSAAVTDGAISWVAPVAPVAFGNHVVTVRVSNQAAASTITDLRLAYTDGTVTEVEDFDSLAIAPGASQTFSFAVPYSFSIPVGLKAYIMEVNGIPDGLRSNDTTAVQNLCATLAAGNYTINAGQPTGGINFASFTEAAASLASCGIDGAVVFTVAPGSGPYNEQVELQAIPGASATNTVTFKGNNQVLTFAATSAAAPHVLKLNGAAYVTIDSLQVTASGTSFGWGIHLSNGADNNTISNSTISASTSLSSSNDSYGIIATGLTATDLGNHANNTTIVNNTIVGGYNGIRINGSATAAAAGNRVEGNNVRDSYESGIFLNHSTGAVVEGNDVSRPTRTSVTTFAGVELNGQTAQALVSKNRIHNSHDATTSNAAAYGIYVQNSSGNPAANNIVANNLIYNLNTGGHIYGLYTSGSGIHLYHNTVFITGSTAAGSTTNWATRGFYHSGTASDSVWLKNNIISITRGGNTSVHMVYLNIFGTKLISENNVLHLGVAGTAYFGRMGGTSGSDIATFADWQANGFDLNSRTADPGFTNAAAGNFVPTSPLVNNIGQPLAAVADDYSGAARNASTPDPGAYEFDAMDASIAWVAPVMPVAAGNQTITVSVANEVAGTTITSLKLAYTDGTVTEVEDFTGLSLTAAASQNFSFAVPYSFTVPVGLKAYIMEVNGSLDGLRSNDTTAVQNLCATLAAGNYTINAGQPTGGTNFATFAEAAARLASCGIDGAVVFTVAPGSGPYNEQVELQAIPGASATNTVTFKGNNQVLTFAATTAAAPHVLKLNGAAYVTIDSLQVTASGTSFGWGIHLSNGADHNTISNSTISASTSLNGSNDSYGIIATGPTASDLGNHANNTTIVNNTIVGGYNGIRINGSATVAAAGNRVEGNSVRDFYESGIFLNHSTGAVVEGNDVSRPTRTSITTFAGVELNGQTAQALVSKNRIHNSHGSATTNTAAAYGIQLENTNSSGSTSNMVVNNLVYNLNGSGNVYGIFTQGADAHVYHNTISIAGPATAAANRTTRGIQHAAGAADSAWILNNIISITRGGSNVKHYALYFDVASPAVTSNHNVLHVAPVSGTGLIAGYGGATSVDFATLTNWQAAGKDGNSVATNPVFVNAAAFDFTPTSLAADNIGTPLTAVTTDILGAARSTTTPDAGAFEFTGVVTGITEAQQQKLGVQVWPNPFTNYLTLQVNSKLNGAVNVTIRDAVGKVVFQQNAASANCEAVELQLSESLPAGIYLMSVEQNNEVSYHKLIKR